MYYFLHNPHRLLFYAAMLILGFTNLFNRKFDLQFHDVYFVFPFYSLGVLNFLLYVFFASGYWLTLRFGARLHPGLTILHLAFTFAASFFVIGGLYYFSKLYVSEQMIIPASVYISNYIDIIALFWPLIPLIYLINLGQAWWRR
ncbi:MAG: hypothetical protein AAFU64_20460 [Bacteroidota bacterium]